MAENNIYKKEKDLENVKEVVAKFKRRINSQIIRGDQEKEKLGKSMESKIKSKYREV